MALVPQLEAGLKEALKSRSEFAVNAFREMLGVLRYAALGKSEELSPADELEALSKLKKRHLESIAAFELGQRSDLVTKEREELTVIERFLPAPLGPEEIKELVRKVILELAAAGLKDMGKVMAALKDSYLGRADGKAVSAEVRSQLSELGGA